MSHGGKALARQASDRESALWLSGRAARLRGMASLVVAVLALAGCTVTGNGLNTAGLDRIVVGRTTLAQASQDLGAQPTDTWQQGDTLLARWAYKGTVATDAVYVRQEVWLRFGPDGTFQQMENSVNVPALRHPRTAAEADRAAAEPRANEQAKANAAPGSQAEEYDGMIVIPGNGESTPIPVSAPPPVSGPVSDPLAAQPLLPAGTTIVPGVTYPVPR